MLLTTCSVTIQYVLHCSLGKTPQNKYSTLPLPVKGHAMIDSGALSCFISKEIVKNHKLFTYKLSKPKKLNVIDGREILSGRVEEGCDLEFIINGHKEILSCYVVELGHHHIILGMSWLQKHSPLIDWKKETVSFTSPYCQKECLASPVNNPVNMFEPTLEASAIEGLPTDYQDFSDVFREDKDTPLPPHRKYDLAIELEPGSKPTWGPLYNLGGREDEELKESIERWKRQGFIWDSVSPMASPILFVKNKNGKYRMCVDYRKLNAMTIKNHYPLPCTTELIDKLQGAK